MRLMSHPSSKRLFSSQLRVFFVIKKMGGEDLKLCNERLDDLIGDLFETLNKIFSLRDLLKQSLNQGYFHMAKVTLAYFLTNFATILRINFWKARYSMGVQSVTSLQYNLTEHSGATYKVSIDDDDLVNPFASLHIEDATIKEETTPSSLRSRHHNPANEGQIKSKTTVQKNNDPLKWFGVLVPQPLRQSQQNFGRSLDIACQIVQLQSKLRKIQDNYKMELKKKSLLSKS